MTAIVMDLTKE